jgi:hypothetical protein
MGVVEEEEAEENRLEMNLHSCKSRVYLEILKMNYNFMRLYAFYRFRFVILKPNYVYLPHCPYKD